MYRRKIVPTCKSGKGFSIADFGLRIADCLARCVIRSKLAMQLSLVLFAMISAHAVGWPLTRPMRTSG